MAWKRYCKRWWWAQMKNLSISSSTRPGYTKLLRKYSESIERRSETKSGIAIEDIWITTQTIDMCLISTITTISGRVLSVMRDIHHIGSNKNTYIGTLTRRRATIMQAIQVVFHNIRQLDARGRVKFIWGGARSTRREKGDVRMNFDFELSYDKIFL